MAWHSDVFKWCWLQKLVAHGEIKYRQARVVLQNGPERLRRRLLDGLSLARVYVYDPAPALRVVENTYLPLFRSEASFEASLVNGPLQKFLLEQALCLAPSLWQTWSDISFDGMILDEWEPSRSAGPSILVRKEYNHLGGNAQGCRRYVLRDQCVNHDVLPLRWFRTIFDPPEWEPPLSRALPFDLMIRAASAEGVFDRGSGKSIERLGVGKEKIAGRLAEFLDKAKPETPLPGRILEDSNVPLLQMADIAAGHCRQLFELAGMPEVTKVFRQVVYNGRIL